MNWEDELRKLSAPDPPGELLARILASRAAGARVLLPGVAHQRFTRRELVVAAAAAVVIALAIVGLIALVVFLCQSALKFDP